MSNISTINKTDRFELIYHESDNMMLNIISIIDLFIIVLGTFGNLTCFYLLTRKRMRCVTSLRYLSILTLTDCISLYGWYLSSVFRQLNDESHLKRLENISALCCKLISYISFTSLQFSSFLLCIITIDRLLIITSSKWRAKYTTPSISNRIIIFSALFYLALNLIIPLHIGNKGYVHYKIKKFTQNSTLTEYTEKFILGEKQDTLTITMWHCYDDNDLVQSVWKILHLCLYSLIPFPILCVLNLIVIHKTRDAAKQASEYNLHRVKHGKEFVTRLLMFLTISFIFTTLPSTIVYAFWHQEILGQKFGRLILNILNTIQFSRHSFNWLIYLYSSTFMRIELKKCVSCTNSDYELAQVALARRPTFAIEIIRQIEQNENKISTSDIDHLDLYYLYCLYERERMALIDANNDKTCSDSAYSKNKINPESINYDKEKNDNTALN